MEHESSVEITRLLAAVSDGQKDAEAELLDCVYNELLQLARQKLAPTVSHGSIQATALVNEAYIKIFGNTDVDWENRRHFFGAAARAMHDIVVDYARRRNALKRGGGRRRVDLEQIDLGTHPQIDDMVVVGQALDRLREVSVLCADVVMLRFYCGFNHDEIAQGLDLSRARVRREWAYAKAFLYKELHDDGASA